MRHYWPYAGKYAAYEKADFSENDQFERWRLALFSDPANLCGWVATDGGRLFGFMTVTIEFVTWSAEQRMGAQTMAKIRFRYAIDTQEAAC